MNNSSWGVLPSQLDDIARNYEGRIVVQLDDKGPPSRATLIQHNHKRATVRINTTVHRVSLNRIKPPADYKFILETNMPPEAAPRPNKAINLGESSMPELGEQILYVAARLQNNAKILAEKREAFEPIEKDYVAMKQLRDEAKAELEKIEKEAREIKAMLDTASARLLSGNRAGV
jgi:hypothetical protein